MKLTTYLLIFLTILTPCFAWASENWQEFAVWPTTDAQELPEVYGNIIVWQQFVTEYGDYDIYIADISNPAETVILVIGYSNDQTNPSVFENKVVWQDYVVSERSADWDITMADISNFTAPEIFFISDIMYNNEEKPSIHGNTVVWQDGNAGDLNIYGADITEPTEPKEFPIAAFEYNQQRPSIYRTTVVWQDEYLGDWDIFAADIWQRNKPAEFPVTVFENDQQNPRIYDNIVVWQDIFFGDWDIYAADISDLSNPIEFAVATNESSQTNPDIDGNIIVWQDYRNNNWDIFGYNLTTNREFQITDNPNDQTNPAISGNVVVWQDNYGQIEDRPHSQIYAVILEGPEIKQSASDVADDVNRNCKVDRTDVARNRLEYNHELPRRYVPQKQRNRRSASSKITDYGMNSRNRIFKFDRRHKITKD